jgi:hypothetical protein
VLPTTNKILSNSLLSRLTPNVDGIIGDHQCGFRRNRSPTDQILCTCHILERKNGSTMGQYILLVDFEKVHDSLRRALLYNILTEVGIPMKLFRLIKMCLNKSYSKVRCRC